MRIRIRLNCSDGNNIGTSSTLLATILESQNKFGDETKKLFERSLALCIRHEGLDGSYTAVGSIHLSQLHCHLVAVQTTASTAKTTQLLLAKSYSEEGLRIQTKISSPTHQNTVATTMILANILRELFEL
jgi:hypothetical protein